MANPLSNQDVATKNYVDINAFTTAGGVVSGDIKLNVGSDLVRCHVSRRESFCEWKDSNM